MDLWLAMSVFRRVAEAGGFSAVARQTGLSQPTVSRLVAGLEHHLGTKLINRSTRQLNLTELGTRYYEQCARMLDELTTIETELRDQQAAPTGTLRISTPITFGRVHILPHLWPLLQQHPQLNIEVVMDDHYDDLIKQGIDVAIRIGDLHDSNLVAQKLGSSPRVIFASPAYLAARGTPRTLQDLKQHDCIVYTLLTTRDQWYFNQGRDKIRVRGRFSTNSPDAVRAAALAGMGIAATPIWLINDCLADGRLRTVLQGFTPTPMDIHAVYPERRLVPAKVRYFVDYLRVRLGPSLNAETPDHAGD